jgi:beta-galactosidase
MADLDGREWHSIQVPGNWQLDPKIGDQPIYTNMPYPFEKMPPEPPTVNPTGWYRTSFNVPEDWSGRSIFLLFESCDSACHVWVNGREVGYSKDSKLPHEFDITSFTTCGTNTLAVMVPRYCDGFYLEDQDYWHLSGIQRDVILYAKPRVHIRDFTVQTTFNFFFTEAELLVRGFVNTTDKLEEGYSLEITLYEAEGDAVFIPLKIPVAMASPMYGDTSQEYGSSLFRINVTQPKKWTAETPYLYTFVIVLLDPKGRVTDVESTKVGFRQVEIRDRQLLLNGRRLIIRGVNRHEHHPEKGRAMSAEDMRREIVAMKQLNFNAVRTSHYPNHPVWYDLCDELGMYVVDEANLETHGVDALLTKDPIWMNAFMERGQRMVLRDKNHPSVIVWSLGNESYYGPHHAAMHAWIKFYDPTRPVQYESGFPGKEVSDIICPMYPQLAWVEEILMDRNENRPVIMCEYAYSKGNANGNLHKYWEAVDRYGSFQGGFVWDWADKALIRTINGKKEWAYGNEFDGGIGPDGFDYGSLENPQMCLNGIVGPDLVPWPGAFELMRLQAPMCFSTESAKMLLLGQVTVHNKHVALRLDHLEVLWELTQNGDILQSGTIPFPSIEPGEKGVLIVPIKDILNTKANAEYWLNLVAIMKESTAWCQKGHRVSWDQFAVPYPTPGFEKIPDAIGELCVDESDEYFVCQCDSTTIRFNKVSGFLDSLVYRGRELLRSPLCHAFIRARTDNDYIIGKPGSYFSDWEKAGLDRLQPKMLECNGGKLSKSLATFLSVVQIRGTDQTAGFLCSTIYTIRADGMIEVEVKVTADRSLPCFARIGMDVSLHNALENLSWYGRGPHENYVDRKGSALVGIYESTVEKQFVPYIDPSECGGHEDTRWLTLTDDHGVGLRIEGSPVVHFSALHYKIDDLMAADHVYKLHRTDEVQLSIDGFHMGVGGDTGWTRNVHPEYLLNPSTYRFGFRLNTMNLSYV